MCQDHTIRIITTVVVVLSGATWLAGCSSSEPERGRAAVSAPPSPPDAGRQERRAPSGAADPNDARLQELQGQVQHVDRQVQELQARQRDLLQQYREVSQLVSALASQPEGITPASADDNVGETSREVEEAREQERVALLDSELTSQAIDPAWSTTAAHQIVTALEQVGSGPEGQPSETVTLLGSRCASTLCQVEVGYDSQAAMDQFIDEFPHYLGWNSNAHIRILGEQNESGRAVVYIARDGHSLPK